VDIITGADAGWLPQVRVYNGATLSTTPSLLIAPILAFPRSYHGGVRVAAGDLNGDGRAEIIAASGAGMVATVHIYSGASRQLVSSFKPFRNSTQNGLFVAAGDVNGDGVRDVIVSADRGWLPWVSVFDGASAFSGHAAQLARFLAFPKATRTGVRVATQPTDGGTPGNVEKSSVFLTSGPRGGAASFKLRQAMFTGLTPALVDRVFQDRRIFNGLFVG